MPLISYVAPRQTLLCEAIEQCVRSFAVERKRWAGVRKRQRDQPSCKRVPRAGENASRKHSSMVMDGCQPKGKAIRAD
jgi:hypothetical protein